MTRTRTYVWMMLCAHLIRNVVTINPKFIWPLYYDNPFLEKVSHGNSGERGCSLSRGGQYPSNAYDTVRYSGKATSYLQVDVPNNALTDFSFSVAFMAKSTNGTIFHFQTTAGSTSGITDLIMRFDPDGVYLDILGGGTTIAALTYSTTIAMDVWYTYIMTYDISKPKIVLIASTITDVVAQAIWVTPYQILLPGKIRFGVSFVAQDMPLLHGDIACFSIIDDKLGPGDILTVMDMCSPGGWMTSTPPSTTGGCSDFKGYVHAIQKDAAVNNAIATFTSGAAISRVRCVAYCLQLASCVSFTYNKETNVCKTYTDDHQDDLVDYLGTNYYLRREVSCC